MVLRPRSDGAAPTGVRSGVAPLEDEGMAEGQQEGPVARLHAVQEEVAPSRRPARGAPTSRARDGTSVVGATAQEATVLDVTVARLEVPL